MKATLVLGGHQSPLPSPPLQSAVGWEYQAQLSKHESQTDAAKGFGGKFGVQKDRVDQVSDGGRVTGEG